MRSFLIYCLFIAGTFASHAYGMLDLDEYVNSGIDGSGNRSKLTAYKVHGSCTEWKYIPSYLVARVDGHTTSQARTTINQVDYTALTSNLALTASSPANESDIASLRKLIAARKSPECGAVPESSISLTAAQIKIESVFKNSQIRSSVEDQGNRSTAATSSNEFRQVLIPIEKGDSGGLRNPFSVWQMNYFLDATNDQSMRTLKKAIGPSERALMDLRVKIAGVMTKVNSKIVVTGSLDALYATHIEEHCTSDSTSTMDHAIPVGLYTHDGSSIKCEQKFVTQLVKGFVGTHIKFEHGPLNYPDGSTIYVTILDANKVPVEMELQPYLEMQLFAMLVLGNAPDSIKKFGDLVARDNQGYLGQSGVGYDVKSEVAMSLIGYSSIYISVVAKDWSLNDFDFSYENKRLFACFIRNYDMVTADPKFSKALGEAAMPVYQPCYANPEINK